MRLIDADVLIEWIDAGHLRNPNELCFSEADVVEMIDHMPTIEPKKGKWIPHREKSREYIGTVLVNVSYDYWFCDTCDYRVKNGQPMYNFCPNCGADMRGEAE